MANKIAVIGGGAAGFFAAVHAANRQNEVVIFEKSGKLLSKVKVSGGGRCNVTHDCKNVSRLVSFYPRGGKSLRKGFEQFNPTQTMEWFENRGVRLKVESDGRIFPVSNDSQTIIDCLLKEANRRGVKVSLKSEVEVIQPKKQGFTLTIKAEKHHFDKVIVATGGSNKPKAYNWLADLGLNIKPPIPSLFTFNTPDYGLKSLMGLSVKEGIVQIPGTKWKESGPILITHWGFSGPGVIKLSSKAAEDLHKADYHFPILINWTRKNEDQIRELLLEFKQNSPKKKLQSHAMFGIPSRLWIALCEKAEIQSGQELGSISKKSLNKLVEHLVRDPYSVKGKTTFKEEFVTCGGVELSDLNLKTFETKSIPGLFLVGEILNVDGLTGGFNFQHAWTSGYLAGSAAGVL